MRVLITGSRFWTDYDLIYKTLKLVHDTERIDIVIEGGCRGADLLGRQAAESLGIAVIEYPAEWKRYGKSAGSIRNQQMLDEAKPDLVLAFHDNLNASSGTAHMVAIAKKAGVKVTLVFHAGGG